MKSKFFLFLIIVNLLATNLIFAQIEQPKLAYLKEYAYEISNIFVIDLDGRNRRQITFFNELLWNLRWFPDGSKIFFLTEGGQAYTINSNGSGLSQISLGDYFPISAEISSDGTKIVWEIKNESSLEKGVFVSNADGSDLLQFTPFAFTERAANFTPDGRIIYRDFSELLIIDLLGQNRKVITVDRLLPVYTLHVSQNGEIVYFGWDPVSNHILNIDGTQRRTFYIPFQCPFPRSPKYLGEDEVVFVVYTQPNCLPPLSLVVYDLDFQKGEVLYTSRSILGDSFNDGFGISSDNSFLVFAATNDLSSPYTIYKLDLTTMETIPIVQENFLRDIALQPIIRQGPEVF